MQRCGPLHGRCPLTKPPHCYELCRCAVSWLHDCIWGPRRPDLGSRHLLQLQLLALWRPHCERQVKKAGRRA